MHMNVHVAFGADPGHTVMGELTLFGAAANTAGFEAAIHMVRADTRLQHALPQRFLSHADQQSPDALHSLLRCCGSPQDTCRRS